MKYFRYFILTLFIIAFSNYVHKNEIKTIRIGMCSDVHLPTMHDSESRITTFIESMKKAKPDFIIELGDFGTPDEKYAHYFDIWNSFPGNKYHIIGNHEMDGSTSLKDALAYRNMKNSYYSFSRNGFKFIVLDGNDKKDPNEKGYRAYIGKLQLNWLKEELSKSNEPMVIFSHQGIGTDPNTPGERYSIENSDSVRQILENHNEQNKRSKVICCFNGHSHHDYAENIKNIWYITINSMSYKWLGQKYEHIRYSNEIDKEYKWIKFTAPYKDPLFTIVEISTEGFIKMSGKKSEYVGPSPWELGYPDQLKKFVRPQITNRVMKISIN